jgi:hypothetical protein
MAFLNDEERTHGGRCRGDIGGKTSVEISYEVKQS